jgi:hypothetical protein
MANTLVQEQPQIFSGLGTLSFTVPSTGQYFVSCQTTENPVSGLSIVVNQNGSAKYTSPTITATQEALQFFTVLQCTAADAITVVITGNSGNDALYNTVKTSVAIGSGT